jgi:methionyl-tRNA formyltransferase
LTKKIRHVWRTQGLIGFSSVLASRFRRDAKTVEVVRGPLDPSITQLPVEDFHAPAAISAIRGLGADLGVVVGTYILRESVFALPRLGSINLHSGKAPEYRGAAPGFWELYNGEREVGITIHRVSSVLDAGHILRQETVPLNPAPVEDPMTYLEQYRREVLRPEGVRLIVETVVALATGAAVEQPQDSSRARTYRSPDLKAVRELRRRVAARRQARTS